MQIYDAEIERKIDERRKWKNGLILHSSQPTVLLLAMPCVFASEICFSLCASVIERKT